MYLHFASNVSIKILSLYVVSTKETVKHCPPDSPAGLNAERPRLFVKLAP